MSRAGVERAVFKARIAAADKVIADGGTLRTFANRIGLTPPGALFWLRRNDLRRLEALVGGSPGNAMAGHKALVRLLLVKSVEGFPYGRDRLARGLGLRPGALNAFVQRWAPDGLDAAIADLMPDDGEAAHG